MNVAPTPFYLSEYFGGHNVMVLVMDNGNYEVQVTIQDGKVITAKFPMRLYTEALRFHELQDLLIKRINRKITAITG